MVMEQSRKVRVTRRTAKRDNRHINPVKYNVYLETDVIVMARSAKEAETYAKEFVSTVSLSPLVIVEEQRVFTSERRRE